LLPRAAKTPNAIPRCCRRQPERSDQNELAAVADFLAHNGPELLDVATMPPTITPAQMKGFGLWALHAVMNGRGDGLLDLARSNLLR